MLSRLVVQAQPMLSTVLARTTIQKIPLRSQIVRQFHREGRETITRSERIASRQGLKERILAPAGPNGNNRKLDFLLFHQSTYIKLFLRFSAFAIGKGAMAGGAVLGLGALCYYGLGMGGDSQTILNNSM